MPSKGSLGKMTEDDALDRAVAAFHVRRTFRKEGRAIELALLLRTADLRPLVAPWWRGKEVYILAVDLDGNFFLRHCDGSVRYWQHRLQADVAVARSVREFVEDIGDSSSGA